MKKTELNGYVYEFRVDYVDVNTYSSPISVAEYLLSVHWHFMLQYKMV